MYQINETFLSELYLYIFKEKEIYTNWTAILFLLLFIWSEQMLKKKIKISCS